MVLYISDYWPISGTILIYGVFFGIVAAVGPVVMLEAAGSARYPKAVALMNLCAGVGNVVGGLCGGRYHFHGNRSNLKVLAL